MRLNLPAVDKAKETVRQELAEVEAQGGVGARLNHIQNRLHSLEGKVDKPSLLMRYVFVVSALVHHARFGGLSQAEVKELLSLGRALLQILGITDRKSRLSILQNDLHAIESQLLRQSGQHWQALWHQLIAGFFPRRDEPSGPSFQALSLASRALRLGNADLAIEYYSNIKPQDLDEEQAELVLVGRVKAHRLAARFAEARVMIEAAKMDFPLSPQATQEITWEEWCLEASAGAGNITKLVAATQRGKEYFSAGYYLESYFWAGAVNSTKWQSRFVKMDTLARNKNLDTASQGAFFKCAACLEQAYDQEIPLINRLTLIGETLRKTPRLISVDKELLCWLAFSRALARQGALELAAATFYEYRSLSFKLSGGRCPDVLGIASDLFDKSWLKAI